MFVKDANINGYQDPKQMNCLSFVLNVNPLTGINRETNLSIKNSTIQK